jgi:MFS family permease
VPHRTYPAEQPWHLVLALGVLYPIGAAAYYMPAATLLFQWFNARRGFASGVMYSGTGIGGAVFPFAMQALLDHAGYRLALITFVSPLHLPHTFIGC